MLDQGKIGKFIAERRKTQKLTQKQLAEKLNVSDKAVSKWETGRSLPDNALLLELCGILSISVNELLSGELLPAGSYHRKAEENMMNLIKVTENEKTMRRRTWYGMLIGVALLAVLLWCAIILSQGSIIWYLDMVSLLAIVSVTAVALLSAGHMKAFISAFTLCFGKKDNAAPDDVRRSVHACKLAMAVSGVSGVVITLISMISLLSQDLEPEVVGPNISVALLTTLYGLILVLFILPVMGRLNSSVKCGKMES